MHSRASVRLATRFTSTDPGASHSNSTQPTPVESISNNTTDASPVTGERNQSMTEYSAKRDPTRCPSHPGMLLRKVVIPATGRSKAEIAALLGISRQHLHDILAEKKPVSAHVAVRLGKLFGDGAG